ncbi:glycine-rich domain-containing protein [Kitasatospora sp. NPDC008115]|uniref:glycine-rich domain-containing protein n=1 Tax=Kitasatospora sp. NPDC008115 TaxID=3364022 RepID=UPI0036EF72D3
MTSISTERITGRSLVDPALFGRLVARIVEDEVMDQALAERVMDQALAFLGACAANPDAGLSPSGLVDIGWHTFILHTLDYAEFCRSLSGRFLHHMPTDGPDDSTKGVGIAATVAVIEASGYAVDTELWSMSADCSEGSGGDGSDSSGSGNCSQCHRGCHSS